MQNFGLKFTVAAISAIKSLIHRLRLHLLKFGHNLTSLRHRDSQCHWAKFSQSTRDISFQWHVVLIFRTTFSSLTFINDLKIKTFISLSSHWGVILYKLKTNWKKYGMFLLNLWKNVWLIFLNLNFYFKFNLVPHGVYSNYFIAIKCVKRAKFYRKKLFLFKTTCFVYYHIGMQL